MKKKLSVCVVVVCMTAMISVPAYATDTGVNNSNQLSMIEQKEVLDGLTDEHIKKVIPNEAGEESVQEIMNEKEVDNEFVERLSNEGDVQIEQIDDQNIAITVDVDEPTSTIIYDNGIKVEEKEKIGMVIENESELSTEEYVDEMEEIVNDSSQNDTCSASLKFNLIEPVHAYDEHATEVTTEGPTSKIKLKKRIIYYFVAKGGGVPLQNWYKIIRSSSKIMSTKYKVKSLQMKTNYTGFASSVINDFKKMSIIKGSKSGTKVASPATNKYYQLASPTSKWFNEYYGFTFKTQTVMEYVKSGATKTSTYQITFGH